MNKEKVKKWFLKGLEINSHHYYDSEEHREKLFEEEWQNEEEAE